MLVDAFVVDASGNHASLSKVALTGDSISEQANALIVSNSKIVINNVLQTPVIKTSINFQFRGVVDVSGAGNGIQYTSSSPDLIGVTEAGIIYPLKETQGAPVYITVSYQGLEPILIPVEVDFTKN